MNALIVAIEGIDGAGKSTLIVELERRLNEINLKTYSGKLVVDTIELLKESVDAEVRSPGIYQELIPDDERADLYAVEAYITLRRLKQNCNIDIALFDRWFPILDARIGNEVEWSVGATLPRLAARSISWPHVTFWLDISPCVAAQRLTHRQDWMVKRYNIDDLIELLTAYRQKYILRWHSRASVIRLDAEKSISELADVMMKVINERLQHHKANYQVGQG